MPERPNTELEAANLALSEIGEPPIGAFGENNARARRVGQWFGIVRDLTQRQHDYGFCSAWFAPAMNPVAALGPYINRFALPDDCLKVREVRKLPPSLVNPTYIGGAITDPATIAALEADTPGHEHGWDIENPSVAADAPAAAMMLVTNLTAPLVNYTRRVTIVRLWAPDYCTAFAKELGSKIAPPLAKDLNAGAQLHAQYLEEADDAARTDSREESPRHISRETSWVRSTLLGGGYRSRRW